MSERQETIEDIIAWLRRPREGENAYLTLWRDEIADRLEAAQKREAGDAAKLREALGKLRAELWNNTVIAGKRKIELYEIADAALAAPPRNCDRFATIDEARKAHEAICEKYGKCHNGCPLNNEEHYSAFDCFEAWLYAPATEKEGESNEQK